MPATRWEIPNQVGTRAAGHRAIPPGSRRELSAPAIRRKPAPAAARTARDGRPIIASSVGQQPPSSGLNGASGPPCGTEQLRPSAVGLVELDGVADMLIPFRSRSTSGLSPQVSFKSSRMTIEDELTIGEAARMAGV